VIGRKLLASLYQDTSTHISNHIHEWRQRCRMIKAQIPNQLLMEWLTKSLLPPISKDVSIAGETSEETAILRSQHLDLIYSQSDTLYNIISHSLWSSMNPHRPNPKPHFDDMIVDLRLVQYFTANIFSIKEQKIYNAKYTHYTEIFPLETQTGKTNIFYIHS
jgi:hypothetical protein